jgi:hypothetical protein
VITIVQQPWQTMLMDRLKFRKVWNVTFSRQQYADLCQSLIELFETQLSQPHSSLLPTMIDLSLHLMRTVMTATPSAPTPDSPACLAFDPEFARVLVSYIPLHVIQLPDQAHTWASLEGLLMSLKDVNDLANTAEILTWEVNAIVALILIDIKTSSRLPGICKYGVQGLIVGFHTYVQLRRQVVRAR